MDLGEKRNMPIHDWTRVDAGIFHHFHHGWIEELARALNNGLLPNDHYAMAEQHAAGLGPDVLTLQGSGDEETNGVSPSTSGSGGGLLLATSPLPVTAETDLEFYRRKQNTVTVRHVSGDRVVAMIEVVSPGNKNSRKPLRAFVAKVGELLDRQIHLLILDLHPPGPRDPHGIHAEIWEDIAGQVFLPPADKPLTLVAYETDLAIRAYVKPVAVGDTMIDMPLFLSPRQIVPVPLEATYQTAFAAVPRRWRVVLERPTP
jgi:Protein of unknown function (DUF4058)